MFSLFFFMECIASGEPQVSEKLSSWVLRQTSHFQDMSKTFSQEGQVTKLKVYSDEFSWSILDIPCLCRANSRLLEHLKKQNHLEEVNIVLTFNGVENILGYLLGYIDACTNLRTLQLTFFVLSDGSIRLLTERIAKSICPLKVFKLSFKKPGVDCSKAKTLVETSLASHPFLKKIIVEGR